MHARSKYGNKLSIIKVKGYADSIRNAIPTNHCKQEQTRTTTCFNMCRRSTERGAEEFDEFPDIDVELVGVIINERSMILSHLVSNSMFNN